MDTITKTLLHLSLVPQVGPAAISKLIPLLTQGTDLYRLSVAEVAQCGITTVTATAIVQGLQDDSLLKKELSLLTQHPNISVVTVCDTWYPELLKTIHIPPTILYVQGDGASFNKGIALVGARAANEYGKKVVNRLVPDLVAQGWSIVSGGAYGVDTFCHQATLEAGGRTVVVLGSGLLQPYPQQNIKLFKAVADNGGVVISSFPLTMEGLPHNFPARNRIIAGMSQGTIVVQAAQKSGALITAQFALDEGRSVFAVPGPINDPLSAGCHALITQGARLISCADDVVQEFGVSADRVVIPVPVQQRITFEPMLKEPKKDEKVDPIVAVCKEPQSLDQLIAVTKISEQGVRDRLFELELEGVITQNFAGLWETI